MCEDRSQEECLGHGSSVKTCQNKLMSTILHTGVASKTLTENIDFFFPPQWNTSFRKGKIVALSLSTAEQFYYSHQDST